MTALAYVSEPVLAELRQRVRENIPRYRSGTFEDFVADAGWSVPLQVACDGEAIRRLVVRTGGTAASEDLVNSLRIGEALKGLSPALANEERVWVRLCHVEGIAYLRERWLRERSDDRLVRLVLTHAFAPTQTAVRDDNALARLWWNYHIAETCMPTDVERALRLIVSSADIRSNFVERIWTTSRRPLAASVLRAMDADERLREDDAFRMLMKTLNRSGGGIVLEALDDAELDLFVSSCVPAALDG